MMSEQCRRATARIVKYRGAICFVLLEMAVEICLLTETAVAQRAFERLLLVVNVAYVALQIGRNAERSFAVPALIRLFTRMSPQVTGKISRAWKHFPAELARVAILQFPSRSATIYLNSFLERRGGGFLMIVDVLRGLLLRNMSSKHVETRRSGRNTCGRRMSVQ